MYRIRAKTLWKVWTHQEALDDIMLKRKQDAEDEDQEDIIDDFLNSPRDQNSLDELDESDDAFVFDIAVESDDCEIGMITGEEIEVVVDSGAATSRCPS